MNALEKLEQDVEAFKEYYGSYPTTVVCGMDWYLQLIAVDYTTDISKIQFLNTLPVGKHLINIQLIDERCRSFEEIAYRNYHTLLGDNAIHAKENAKRFIGSYILYQYPHLKIRREILGMFTVNNKQSEPSILETFSENEEEGYYVDPTGTKINIVAYDEDLTSNKDLQEALNTLEHLEQTLTNYQNIPQTKLCAFFLNPHIYNEWLNRRQHEIHRVKLNIKIMLKFKSL